MSDYEAIMSTYEVTPESEITDRINRLQEIMKGKGVAAALIQQLIDRFYFSGTIQDGVIVVPAEGDPVYLCRRSVSRASAETPLTVVPFRSLKEIPPVLSDIGVGAGDTLGFELDVVPAALFLRFSSMLPDLEWADLGPVVREVRAVKSDHELHRIRAAGVQVNKVMDTAVKVLKEGIREIDFASSLEKRARELGHQGILRMRGFNQELFYGHIITGEHSAIMSHIDAPSGGAGVNPSIGQGAGFRTIGAGEPVSVDFVGNVGGYLIDQTRLMVVGDLDADLEEGFYQAKSVQDRVTEAIKPGALWSSLYELASKAAEEFGVQDRFMGPPGEQVRFVGHGVGLEVDEYPFLAPRLDMELVQGMVLALEPKIFHPGRGLTGIEDTFLVTENGCERLTITERDIIRT